MKQHKEIVFRLIEGIWQDVAGDSGTLADTFERLGIIIDDNAQFCRIVRYYEKYTEYIEYRAYNQAKVTVNIHIVNYE